MNKQKIKSWLDNAASSGQSEAIALGEIVSDYLQDTDETGGELEEGVDAIAGEFVAWAQALRYTLRGVEEQLHTEDEELCWMVREGDRWIIPHLDPHRYEHPFDLLFDSEEQAYEALVTYEHVEEAAADKWVLCTRCISVFGPFDREQEVLNAKKG